MGIPTRLDYCIEERSYDITSTHPSNFQNIVRIMGNDIYVFSSIDTHVMEIGGILMINRNDYRAINRRFLKSFQRFFSIFFTIEYAA